jgi:dihydrodipicolinate synthase/N-acetylneuraminate lyase
MASGTDADDDRGADIIERACKRAVVTSTEEQARFVIETVGVRAATAAVGLRDARAIRGWARGQRIKQADAQHRLQELYEVLWALSEAYSPAVAGAFLRGTNPYLGDRAPLVVLADEPPDKSGPALLAAARHLIET